VEPWKVLLWYIYNTIYISSIYVYINKKSCLMRAYIPCGCAQTMWSCLCSSGTTPMKTNNAENNPTTTTSTINIHPPPLKASLDYNVAHPLHRHSYPPASCCLQGGNGVCSWPRQPAARCPMNERWRRTQGNNDGDDTRRHHRLGSSSVPIQVSLHKYSPPFPCLTLNPSATSLTTKRRHNQCRHLPSSDRQCTTRQTTQQMQQTTTGPRQSGCGPCILWCWLGPVALLGCRTTTLGTNL